jgi:hypothetical protein
LSILNVAAQQKYWYIGVWREKHAPFVSSTITGGFIPEPLGSGFFFGRLSNDPGVSDQPSDRPRKTVPQF